jgi:hypothetical protein
MRKPGNKERSELKIFSGKAAAPQPGRPAVHEDGAGTETTFFQRGEC